MPHDCFVWTCEGTQHALVGFLYAELEVGTTFLASALLAHGEGHMEHYGQAKGNSLKAIEAIKKFIPPSHGLQARAKVQDRLAEPERLYATL